MKLSKNTVIKTTGNEWKIISGECIISGGSVRIAFQTFEEKITPELLSRFKTELEFIINKQVNNHFEYEKHITDNVCKCKIIKLEYRLKELKK